MAKNRRKIDIYDEEDAVLDALSKEEMPQRFLMSKRDVLRYIILNAKPLIMKNPEMQIDAVTRDLGTIRARVDELTLLLKDALRLSSLKTGSAALFPKESRKNAKLTEDDKVQRGTMICDVLSGTVDGHMCLYKKYEIGPGGRPQRPYEVGVALAALTEQHVQGQYFPTQEAYKEALEKFPFKEPGKN